MTEVSGANWIGWSIDLSSCSGVWHVPVPRDMIIGVEVELCTGEVGC